MVNAKLTEAAGAVMSLAAISRARVQTVNAMHTEAVSAAMSQAARSLGKVQAEDAKPTKTAGIAMSRHSVDLAPLFLAAMQKLRSPSGYDHEFVSS